MNWQNHRNPITSASNQPRYIDPLGMFLSATFFLVLDLSFQINVGFKIPFSTRFIIPNKCRVQNKHCHGNFSSKIINVAPRIG